MSEQPRAAKSHYVNGNGEQEQGMTAPPNIYGFALAVLAKSGFSGVVSLLLLAGLFYMYKTTEADRAQFLKALQDNTAQISQTNVEIAKTNTLLEEHLKHDEKYNR